MSDPALLLTATTATFNKQNLRGQTLLFRCQETGFITTASALTRYQQGRGIDLSLRVLFGNRPADWIKAVPTTICNYCGMEVRGNQLAFRQQQHTMRYVRAQHAT
jgi:hypothetical protein